MIGLLGQHRPLGNWDLGDSRHLCHDPRRRGLCLQASHLVLGPSSLYLPSKQAPQDWCVLSPVSQAFNALARSREGRGAGLSPQVPTKGREHGPQYLQLLEYNTRLAPVCMRPHTFQGPSTGRAPESKSPEQREQRQKARRSGTSDRSSPARDSPGTRTHTTGKTQDRLHTRSHAHKQAHTHMLTHAHSPVHPVSSGEHFHTETRLPSP